MEISIIMLTLLLSSFIALIVELVAGNYRTALPLAIIFTVNVAALLLMYRGFARAVSRVVPGLVLLLLTQLTFIGHGIHDNALVGFPLVVVLAGLLHGRYAPYFYAALCAGAVVLIYIGESLSWITTPYSAGSDISDVFTLTLLLAIPSVLLSLLIGNLTDSLRQSRRQKRELAKSSAQQEQLITELEARNAELEQFTYTLSHDLKTPLVTIRGFLGLAERDATAGDLRRMREDMARVSSATDQMDRLLSELLDMAQLGHALRRKEAVPFGEVVRESLERIAPRLDDLGVEMVVASEFPVVWGDRSHLIQLMLKLLDNAVSFASPNGRLRVEIGVLTRQTDTVFFVRDNGIGVDPRYQQKIFNLFEMVDPNKGGTGMGLALVRRIVAMHGGRVWCESVGLGEGATFLFVLPTAESPP